MKLLKPRVTALSALSIWSILVAWVSYMYLTQPSIRPISSRSFNAVAPQALQDDIKSAHRTLNALGRLKDAKNVNPKIEQIVHDLLPIIDFTPEQRASIDAAQSGRRLAEYQPVISMIIINGEHRGALVDGSYVREGEKLKNGTIIEKIHDNSITLSDGVGLSRTLTLQNAFVEQVSDDSLTTRP